MPVSLIQFYCPTVCNSALRFNYCIYDFAKYQNLINSLIILLSLVIEPSRRLKSQNVFHQSRKNGR